jgi:hypothetical protein
VEQHRTETLLVDGRPISLPSVKEEWDQLTDFLFAAPTRKEENNTRTEENSRVLNMNGPENSTSTARENVDCRGGLSSLFNNKMKEVRGVARSRTWLQPSAHNQVAMPNLQWEDQRYPISFCQGRSAGRKFRPL